MYKLWIHDALHHDFTHIHQSSCEWIGPADTAEYWTVAFLCDILHTCQIYRHAPFFHFRNTQCFTILSIFYDSACYSRNLYLMKADRTTECLRLYRQIHHTDQRFLQRKFFFDSAHDSTLHFSVLYQLLYGSSALCNGRKWQDCHGMHILIH